MDQAVSDPTHMFADRDVWAEMLDRCAAAFTSIAPGGRIGVVANNNLATPISKLGGEMMVWTTQENGVAVSTQPFALAGTNTDLLFMVDGETLDALKGASADNLAKRLSSRSKRGKMMLYFMIGRDDLEDAGYFEFLESVGLSFLGPCR
ncbi:MAG: hypothetical protein HQ503_04405 [Rhodospirillales bacterium]|nr:hypothetical protein [Rhodospirillales bacterium]